MTPIDQLEVDSIREHLDSTLNELCTIKKRTATNAGTGPVLSESDRAENVPCRRASQYRPDEKPIAGASRSQEDVILTLEIGQAIEVTDRVVFSDASYEVVAALATSQPFCKRVLCRKM
jgi:hypothetical protein